MRKNRWGLIFCALSILFFLPRISGAANFTVDVNDNTDTIHNPGCSTTGTGTCSLRDAILFANTKTLSDQTAINLQATTYTLTIAGQGEDDSQTGDLDVKANATITGQGATATIVEAGVDLNSAVDRVFHIDPTALGIKVTITGVTIRNGDDTAGGGGGILNMAGLENINSVLDAGLTLTNVTVSGNHSSSTGGGVCNGGVLTTGPRSAGALLVNSSLIDTNNADGDGGGVYNLEHSSAAFTDTTISNNNANQSGGGVWSGLQTVLGVNHGTISNNTADKDDNASGDGGGFFLDGGDGNTIFLMNNGSTVSGNHAQNGGGIFNAGIATIDNSVVSGNFAMVDNFIGAVGGGGIYNGGTMVIQDESTIDGNHADLANGGGIYHTQNFGSSFLTVIQTTISNNIAGGDGGGIYRDSNLGLINVTIGHNQANAFSGSNGEGGGIYNNGANQCPNGPLIAFLSHVTIAENSAFSGGGLNVNNACFPVDIKNSIVANNNAPTGANCDVSNGGTLTSSGYNLSSDDTCTPFFTATGDLNNQVPNIGPLADNGGTLPVHPQTYALAFESVAVDAVPPANCTDIFDNALMVDERGFPRPGTGLGPNCDIGAFELQAMAQLTVSPTSLSFTSEVGVTTAAQTITVTSTGNVPATVSGDSLQGVDAGLFAISQDNCTGKILAPTESCTILVTFTPLAPGTFNQASVKVTSGDATIIPTDTVALIGTATVAPVPPGLVSEGSGITCGLMNIASSSSGLVWSAFFWTLAPALSLAVRRKKKH